MLHLKVGLVSKRHECLSGKDDLSSSFGRVSMYSVCLARRRGFEQASFYLLGISYVLSWPMTLLNRPEQHKDDMILLGPCSYRCYIPGRMFFISWPLHKSAHNCSQ